MSILSVVHCLAVCMMPISCYDIHLHQPSCANLLPSSAQHQIKLQLSWAEFALFPLSPTTRPPTHPRKVYILTFSNPSQLKASSQLVHSYLPASWQPKLVRASHKIPICVSHTRRIIHAFCVCGVFQNKKNFIIFMQS